MIICGVVLLWREAARMLLGIEKKNEMHQNVKNRNAFNFGIINYYDYDYYIAAGRTSSFVSSEIVYYSCPCSLAYHSADTENIN